MQQQQQRFFLFLLLIPILFLQQLTTATNINLLLIDWISNIDTPDDIVDRSWLWVDINMFAAVVDFNNRNTNIVPALERVKTCNKNISVVSFCNERGSGLSGAQAITDFGSSLHAVAGFASLGTQFGAMFAENDFNLPLLSHWSTGGTLSNKQEFPLYSRLQLSDPQYSQVMVSFLIAQNYTHVACLHLGTDTGPQLAKYMEDEGKLHGLKISSQYFLADDADSIWEAMISISQEEHSVIILISWVTDVLDNIANFAEELKMNDENHLWVFANLDVLPSYNDSINNVNVTKFLLRSVAILDGIRDDALFVKYVQTWPDRKDMIPWINTKLPPHGTKSESGGHCLNDRINLQLTEDDLDASGDYQQVWARAYDIIITLGMASCAVDANNPVTGKDLYSAIVNIEPFDGLSGRVAFDNTTGNRRSDTIGFTAVKFHPEQSSGVGVIQGSFARFDSDSNSWVILDSNVNDTSIDLSDLQDLFPPQFKIPYHEQNFLPLSLRGLGFAEIFIVNAVLVSVTIWMWHNRKSRILVASQWRILVLICMSLLICSWSILALTVDDDPTSTVNNNANNPSIACSYGPVLFFFGFDLALWALTLKSYRVYTIFTRRQLSANKLTERKVYEILTIGGIIYLILLLIWALLFPASWSRTIRFTDKHGAPLESYGSCDFSTSTGAVGFGGFALLVHLVSLLVATLSAYYVRSLPEEFQEARWINLSVLGCLQLFAITVPTTIAVYSLSIPGRFVVLSTFVFVSCLVLTGFLLVPKIVFVRMRSYVPTNNNPRHSKTGSRIASNNNNSNSVLGTTSTYIVDLVTALRAPTVRKRFERFATEHFILESLYFIEDVTVWKDTFHTETKDIRFKAAISLVEIYCKVGSMMQINVSEAQRERVEKQIHSSTPDTLSANVFDECYGEVCKMVMDGSWQDFVLDGGMFGIVEKNVSKDNNSIMKSNTSIQQQQPV
jgi:hypothetical protein